MNAPATPPVQELLDFTLAFCEECLSRQDFTAAWQALCRAVSLAPSRADVLSHRGRLALFLRDTQAAQRDYAAAVKLDPLCSSAWSGLARYHVQQGDLAAAEAAAERALAIDPADEEAAQVKAEMHRGASNKQSPISSRLSAMKDPCNGLSLAEPCPIFVDSDIRVFEGPAAAERLRERNDLQYLTKQGILQVDRARWQEAQRYERKTWMSNLVNADDDRNHDHRNNFGGYQAIAGRKFRRVIELGCGPFTNLRLVLPHIRAEHITLLDPLIRDYLNHPHCSYRTGNLLGVPVEPVASSIEEYNPSEPYDLLVMANVLEHCFDVPAIFKRILQCLKPSGVLVFGDNVFRPEQLQILLTNQFDAGHPLRVTEPLITQFLKEGFAELYQQRFYGQYDQPHRIDIYFVGIRQPVSVQNGHSCLDLPALLSIEEDATAQKVFAATREHFGWKGQVAMEAANAALKAGRIALAESLATEAAKLLPGSTDAAALRQRITNFKNTFFVTVGQILPDSKMGWSLRNVIGRFRPKTILDLGAASGLGSTTVLAEAVAEHGLAARIYAVESAPHTFEHLKTNVARFACVTPLHGSVVEATGLPTWETVLADVRSRPNHVLEHITVEELRHWYDHTKAETEALWHRQGGILKEIPAKILDLVVIDADLFFAREALAAVIDRTNILVLDDVTEHKNAATHEFLSAQPDWETVDMDLADRHGWSIFRRRQFLGQGASNKTPAGDRPRIHFAYSGDPRNDAAVRAPATITNRIFRFLEQRADVVFYDFTDTTTVPEVRPGDIVLGHPHPNPRTIMRRLLKADCAGKYLMFPFHSRLPEINRFAKEMAVDAQKLFLISGPYWTDSLGATEYAAWQDKIVRLDNSVDLDFFGLRKIAFNPKGQRGLFVLGRSGPEKGTTELFHQLHQISGRLLVAGEYSASDLAILNDRPDTEFVGVLDWRNEPLVRRILAACDFFVNFSVSDASPTTLFETMALGLIPVTTPQCGYTYPSLVRLSLADPEHNLITLRNLQALPMEELLAVQGCNRALVEQNHNWPRFLAALWAGLTGEANARPVASQCQKDTKPATPSVAASVPRRVKVAADYAEKLDLTQIDGDSEFASAIRRLFREHRPRRIVETGTYLGEGTTRVIADTLRQLGMTDAQFHSIEINPEHLARARQNLARTGLAALVQLHHGVSVPRSLVPSLEEIARSTIREIEEDDIFVDHREHERAALYFKETDFRSVPDDLLGRVLRGFGGRPDFVLLDSGGHMGNVEFNYLLGQLEGPCWIALDDVHHIKHRRSLRQMQADNRFEIIVNSTEKFGFCIARFTPARIAAEKGVRRVLWVRTDSIGDAVLASSMLPHLAAKYPSAKIAVLCEQRVADLYLSCPHVVSVVAFDKTKAADDAHLREIISEITAFNPQIILNSVRSRDVLSETLTLAFRSAQHIAIEADLANMAKADHAKAHAMYDRVIPSPATNKPELERHRDFLAGLGVDVPALQPKAWTSPEAEALADLFFQQHHLDPEKTLAIFPGAQHDCRVYAGYAGALKEIKGYDFVVFGAAEDEALASHLINELPGHGFNLCGRSTLRETAALLRRCRLYVGAESAGAHLACAVGVPNVVLLGGGHFGRFMPYSPLTTAVCLPMDCYGCNWQCAHLRAHCVKDVPAALVAEAIRQALAAPSVRARIFIPAEPAEMAEASTRIRHMEALLWGADVEILPIAVVSPVAIPLFQTPGCGLPDFFGQLEAALAAEDMVLSEMILREAHAAFPLDVRVATDLANLQFQRGHYADAISTFRSACQLNPQDPLLPVLLAHAYMKIEDVQGLETAVALAFKVQPGNPHALRLVADLNLKLGRHRDAAKAYGQLVNAGCTEPEVLMALGVCFLQIGDNNGARACFTEVVRQQPAHPEANRQLAGLQAIATTPPPAYAQSTVPIGQEKVVCPCCGSGKATAVRTRADIVQCDSCDVVYLRTRLTKDGMRKLYQSYADGGSHMALPKSREEAERSGLARDYFLKEIIEFVDPQGGFLDVGCGWGGFLLNAQKKGFEPRGIELTRKCVAYANEQLSIPVVDTQLEETIISPGSLSVVSMNHVLEHLPEPRSALKKVINSLRPGGMYCGIVPNFSSACSTALGDDWYWLDPFYHYTHFTPATLRRMLEEAGFNVERMYTATGDYGAENVRKACLVVDAKLAESDYFASELTHYEVEGRGEEIRFFARKPAALVPAKLAEIPVETLLLIPEVAVGPEPVVSVVISAYASEKFMRACLDNLTRQTYFDRCEVIVVDSGSPESERAVVAEFQKEFPNIRYIRTPRETLYAAWNRGLALARGRYWANANTDDGLREDAIEVLVKAMEAHPGSALAYADCVWTSKPNDQFPSPHILKEVRYPDYEPVHTLFYCLTGCLQFWRTESLRQLGGFDAKLQYAGDYEITLRLAAAHGSVVHVPDFLSLFYQNTAGLTQQSTAASEEHAHIEERFRKSTPINQIFACQPGNSLETARAWAALGIYANGFEVPWERQRFQQASFAFECFRKAFESEPECLEACLNYILSATQTGQGELIATLDRSLSSVVQEAHARFLRGESYQRPNIGPALAGPVFDAVQAHPDVLALEPVAIRPWVSRRVDRFTYLSRNLIPHPIGSCYTPKELERLGVQLFKTLGAFPKFYAHFGGAGDALLLLSSFYDLQPNRIVLSYPNSIPAARAFFEAFPGLGHVYFLPLSDDPQVHAILRWIVRTLPNCLGAGATPKEGYNEWKAGLDLEKAYGIRKNPRWPSTFAKVRNLEHVALAPKGSLNGMVGSKRNIIDPAVWPDLLASIRGRGFTPVLLGTPDERAEYPCVEGCEDRRSFSFREQMEQIANSAVFVGADSWGKTFSALAGIPTIVFEPLRGTDWIGIKDASDFVFLDPWDAITKVKSLADFQQVFDRLAAGRKTVPGSAGKSVPVPTVPSAAPSKSALPPQVSWEGSFLDLGSLSHVNRELVGHLKRSPHLRLTCVGQQHHPAALAGAPALQAIAKQLHSHPPASTQVTVRHAWPPNWTPPGRGALVVIQPWEYGSLPADWVRQSSQVQEFWVPSTYVRRMYVESGVSADKVVVVPNGIDPSKFRPEVKPMSLPTSKAFKFLFVGGTIHRKGPDILLSAYLEEFTAADDVCLVIKDFGGQSVYAGQTFEAQIHAAQARPNAPEILYLNEELPPEVLPGLYRACDCLVHPYRGEGFGLPVLEGMACGLPVIVTSGGGADDFAREDLVYRVPANRRSIGGEVSGMKLVGEGWLLEPVGKTLAVRMRHVFEHRDEACAKGRQASSHVRSQWTWEKAAGLAERRLRELAAREQEKADRVARKAAPITLPPCALLGHLAEARQFFNNKKLPAAWGAVRAALKHRPFHPEAYLLMAEIALAAHDAVSARACAQYARQIAPDFKPAKKFLKASLHGNLKPDWLVLPDVIRDPHTIRRPHLSVCLIVKNEERFLGQCLASVEGLADQIVVVDTGSTDRTVEIAKHYKAEVHSFTWCDDFSAARNAALEHVTGDWVLALDADEELPPEQHEALRKLLRAAPVISWRLPIQDVGREAEGCSYVPRLFRNAPAIFYVGRVHEQVFTSLEVRREEWGMESRMGDATLRHHGYTKELTQERDKVGRNLRLLEKAVSETPGEANLLMNYGLELTRSGRPEEGLRQYHAAFEALSDEPPALVVPESREMLLGQFCTQLMATKGHAEIVRVLTSPLAKLGVGLTASLHFTLGLAQMELKEFALAAEQFRQCLAKRNRPALTPVNVEIRKAGPHHCLALCLAQSGDKAAAEREFQAARQDDPESVPAVADYARFLQEQGKAVEGLQLLHQFTSEHPRAAVAWQVGGALALSQPEFLEVAVDWTAEALRHFPEDAGIQSQRAEAMLLSGQPDAALPLWQHLKSDGKPATLAALILCETAIGKNACTPPPELADAVTQEFLNCYRRLLVFGAEPVVRRVNAGVDGLAPVLPRAAELLRSVIAETNAPTA